PVRAVAQPRWADKHRRTGPALILTPALAIYGLFVLWPLIQVVWLALQRWDGYGPQSFVGLGNFGSLFRDSLFRTTLLHSVLWEVAGALISTLIGLGIALLVTHAARRSVFLAIFFFPALLPATVVAAVWTLVYSPLSGLLNTLLVDAGLQGLTRAWLGDPGLALPALFIAWAWSAVGVGTLVLWTSMSTIEREYTEVALVEGAGPVWRTVHVILPAIRRSAALAVLINAALAAQVFDLVFVTTGGGPGYATVLLPIDLYGRAFGGHTGQGAAVGCLQVLLGILLALGALLAIRRGDDGMHGEPAPRAARRLPTLSLCVLAVVLVAPIAWLVLVALGAGNLTPGVPSPSLNPASWGWSNFSTAWQSGMSGAMGASALLALAATLGTVTLALAAAWGLRTLKLPAPLSGALIVLLLLGLFQPTPVLIIPLFALLRTLGLLDSAWGILLPEIGRNMPFAILLLWASLAQAPREVFEASAVDGAGWMQQLIRIAIPLIRPGLLAAAVWSFITSWNEYLLPTLVSQDGSIQTVPTLLATFVGNYDTQYGLLAAGALLALAPSLLVYVVLRRPSGRGLARLERRRT
ncbi:MAG: ABC transporter permease subunit, partial [Chloroflexota bacterium]